MAIRVALPPFKNRNAAYTPEAKGTSGGTPPPIKRNLGLDGRKDFRAIPVDFRRISPFPRKNPSITTFFDSF